MELHLQQRSFRQFRCWQWQRNEMISCYPKGLKRRRADLRQWWTANWEERERCRWQSRSVKSHTDRKSINFQVIKEYSQQQCHQPRSELGSCWLLAFPSKLEWWKRHWLQQRRFHWHPWKGIVQHFQRCCKEEEEEEVRRRRRWNKKALSVESSRLMNVIRSLPSSRSLLNGIIGPFSMPHSKAFASAQWAWTTSTASTDSLTTPYRWKSLLYSLFIYYWHLLSWYVTGTWRSESSWNTDNDDFSWGSREREEIGRNGISESNLLLSDTTLTRD